MNPAQRKGARRRNDAVPDGQIALPLFEPLTRHGLQQIHVRPWVADQEKVRRGRRSAPEAWETWPYVEANPPHVFAAMLFDIDDAERWEYEIDGPTPNWVVRKDERPPTYHAAYTLEIPVARHKHARFAPIAKFRLLSMELGDHFGADPQYDMVLTKNPLNPPEGCSAHWIRKDPDTLDELAEWVPADARPVINRREPDDERNQRGRNCALFYECVKLAHKRTWAELIALQGHAGRWLDHVLRLNLANFAEDPLPNQECKSIAKSCAKYSMRNWSEDRLSTIQTNKITKRWHGEYHYDYLGRALTVAIMTDAGYTQPDIAMMFGVNERTIRRDLAAHRRRVESNRIRPDIP